MIFQRNNWHYDIAINLNLWEATQRHELLQYNFYIQRSTSTGDVIYQRLGGYASQAVELSLVFPWGEDCAAMQYERTGIFHWPPCGVGIAASGWPDLEDMIFLSKFLRNPAVEARLAHPFIHRHVHLSLPLHLFVPSFACSLMHGSHWFFHSSLRIHFFQQQQQQQQMMMMMMMNNK